MPALMDAVEMIDVKNDDGATPSVTKALRLLNALRGARPSLGVSEIARLAGVPKSTAFRLLAFLEDEGYVERTGREYTLGDHLFELGNSVPHCRPEGLRDTAMPFLSSLFVSTGKVVQLAVLKDTDVVYLEKIYGAGAVRVPTSVGARMPAACSALGKAMLAFAGRDAIAPVLHQGLQRRTPYSIAEPVRFLSELKRIRERGVAFDREEVQVGLVCVAAPILRDGRVAAAVSVCGQPTQFNQSAIAEQVQQTAKAIGACL